MYCIYLVRFQELWSEIFYFALLYQIARLKYAIKSDIVTNSSNSFPLLITSFINCNQTFLINCTVTLYDNVLIVRQKRRMHLWWICVVVNQQLLKGGTCVTCVWYVSITLNDFSNKQFFTFYGRKKRGYGNPFNVA